MICLIIRLCFVFSCRLDSYHPSMSFCYPRRGITTIIVINISTITLIIITTIIFITITTIILIYLRRGFLREVTGGRHFPRKMCAHR